MYLDRHIKEAELLQAIATQGAPILSTVEAVATNNPGLMQTAQAFVEQQLPTGEPPLDIPIYDLVQVDNFFGSSQYIFYTTPAQYSQVLEYYKSHMSDNGWIYQETESHEYAAAAS
jgi:hypothetical protein